MYQQENNSIWFRLKRFKSFVVILVMGVIPGMVHAQQYDLTPDYVKNLSAPDIDQVKVITLIVVRFLLVGSIVFGAMQAAISAYKWGTYERNDEKAHQNKESLANWLVYVTVNFLLLAAYHYFVSDVTVLTITR